MKSFSDAKEIVLFVTNYVNVEKSVVYLSWNDLQYVASNTPPAPPFVVAVPGDVSDVILERLKRLAPVNLD